MVSINYTYQFIFNWNIRCLEQNSRRDKIALPRAKFSHKTPPLPLIDFGIEDEASETVQNRVWIFALNAQISFCFCDKFENKQRGFQ